MKLIDSLLSEAVIAAALYLLADVAKRKGDNPTAMDCAKEDLPQVVRCLEDIRREKRKLNRSVKHERQLLKKARPLLAEYVQGLSRDEQIEIIKFLQP